ncbi:MAG: polysaccharide biosynthesis/export family protein [Hyphomicrobiaceae bacterium]
MPAAGPSSEEIESASSVGKESTSPHDKNYVVIDLNHDVVRTLSTFHPTGLRSFASAKLRQPRLKIGVGDVLAITIWEAGEGGLFSSAAGKSVSLPAVVVDRSGKISLPYAGDISVLDCTPHEVQARIVSNLAQRAIQPQAVVSITKNESNTVVLNGEVAKPGRYPLSVKGDRLLDVLAEAGGSRSPANETYVTFIRGDQRGSQLLKEVVDSEAENVWVRAGDLIYLSHEPKRFSVFGAVLKPGVYPFGMTQVNLLEGIAAAGGPLDERADGTGLFVFRHEPRSVVDALRPRNKAPQDSVVPVVYRVNLREPAAYFYAKAMMLQDKDVLYVSNARSIEVAKLLSLFNLGTRTVGNVLPYARLSGD